MYAMYTLILEGLLIWSANLQTAKLMICRVDKQIIRWVENWLNYQQQHKAPAGSFLPVLSLKDQYLGQSYWAFYINNLDDGRRWTPIKFEKNTRLVGAVTILAVRVAIQGEMDRLEK